MPVEVVVVEDREGRGPAWARNEGVRRARGEVVCFTDDDCEPEAGWAEALAAPILAGEAEAATGPVAIGEGATAADRAWEAIVHYLQVRASSARNRLAGICRHRQLGRKTFVARTASLRRVVPGGRGRGSRLGRARGTGSGAAPVFVPAAIVVHRSGMGVGDFLRQQYRYGRGAARYRAGDTDRRPGSPELLRGPPAGRIPRRPRSRPPRHRRPSRHPGRSPRARPQKRLLRDRFCGLGVSARGGVGR